MHAARDRADRRLGHLGLGAVGRALDRLHPPVGGGALVPAAHVPGAGGGKRGRGSPRNGELGLSALSRADEPLCGLKKLF